MRLSESIKGELRVLAVESRHPSSFDRPLAQGCLDLIAALEAEIAELQDKLNGKISRTWPEAVAERDALAARNAKLEKAIKHYISVDRAIGGRIDDRHLRIHFDDDSASVRDFIEALAADGDKG